MSKRTSYSEDTASIGPMSLNLLLIASAALGIVGKSGASPSHRARRQDDCDFVLSLDDGNLFVTGALEGETDGGDATSDTMCIYYFKPDKAGQESKYSGSTWPYVIVPEDCEVQYESDLEDSDLPGRVSLDEETNALLINGRPVYQFTKDKDSCSGNGNTWASINDEGGTTEGKYDVETLENETESDSEDSNANDSGNDSDNDTDEDSDDDE